MASKSQYRANEKGLEISELLDALERLLDRTKTLYEQYFMGIQKMAPAQLHRDAERKIRELTQMQVRNTALRYRLSTVTQKFGVYNTYWRRTMREIEQGRYVRDIARVRRKAQRRGEDLPDEMVANMPKRVRDRIRRDRERLASTAQRSGAGDDGQVQADAQQAEGETAEFARLGQVTAETRDARPHVHRIDDALDNFNEDDFDAMFSALTASAEEAITRREREPTGAAAAGATQAGASGRPRGGSPTGTSERAHQVPTQAQERDQGPAREERTRPGWDGPSSSPGRRPPRRPTQAESPVPAPTVGQRSGAKTKLQWAEAKSRVGSADRGSARGSGSGATTMGPRIGRRAAGANPPPGMTDAQTQAIYKQYMRARQLVGDRSDVPYERMVKTLREQTSRIMTEHNARAVDYRVIIRDDKVILKAKPKK